MIQHEPAAWKLSHQIDGGRNLPGSHKQVEGQPRLENGRHASTDRWPSQPIGIRLVVNIVADADKSFPARESAQLCDLARAVVRLKIDPADDTRDEGMIFGNGKKVAGLLPIMTALHQDG
ncbi:hypothetical protein GCM10007881_42760 [Mesorhizobium huakuii]|nr:hypothetical protein GCM10007881_42760 [Mesorhizobium huakuii]